MPYSARQFITGSQFPFGFFHGNNLVLREAKFSRKRFRLLWPNLASSEELHSILCEMSLLRLREAA